MRRKVMSLLAAGALLSAVFAAEGPLASTRAAAVTDSQDGSNLDDDGADTLGRDAAERAARANTEQERAAMGDAADPSATPAPSGVPDRAQSDPADQDLGLEPDTALDRSVTDPVAEPRRLAEPERGTAASVAFDDSPDADLVDTADLAPYLQREIDTAARSRIVRFSTETLTDDLAAETVSIALFDDVTAELASTYAPSPGQKGSSMWGASSADGADGFQSAVVTIVDGGVIGQWWVDGTQYGMQPLPNGDHVVFEVAREFPDDYDVMPPGPDNGPSPLAMTTDPTADNISSPNIATMVAYDVDAFAFYGSVHQTVVNNAIAMVNLTNNVYINSQQGQNMTLTNVYATGFNPAVNMTTYRNQLANKVDGTFDGVHAVRDANAADFIVLLSNGYDVSEGLCGIAFFPTSANPAENDAYNVTEASCAITGITFPHELGHNQCAGHDVTGGGCNATYPFDKGFVDPGAGLRTVMARNSNTCCTRVPVFSSPDIVFGGWVPGNAGTNNRAVLEDEDAAPGPISGGVALYRGGNLNAIAGTNGQTCVFTSVEDAVNLAPPGSTIYVSPGVHPAETANVNLNIAKNLTITRGDALCRPTVGGASTDVALTLAPGSTIDAVLEVFGGATVRLDRVTVQGGNSAEGTVYVSGGNLNLDAAVVRNGNNPSATVGGGGILADLNSNVTLINDSQIENNVAAGNGGGVYLNDANLVVDGTDNIEFNNATNDGGGIYATNTSTVRLLVDADVTSNTAGGDGGGVALAGNSGLLASGTGSTYVGFVSQINTASRGGGVFAEGGADAIIDSGAAVEGNSATFGGGVYAVGTGTSLVINGGGVVGSNSSTQNGAGVLATSAAGVVMNPGSRVRFNAATGLGGGLAIFAPSRLEADGEADLPALIDGNTAGTVGGGLYNTGDVDFQTVLVHNNSAAGTGGGGGAFTIGTFGISETRACALANLGLNEYCSEFRGNSAPNASGGAVRVNGGSFAARKTGFVGNSAQGAAVVSANGSASADLRGVMVHGNSQTVLNADGLVTGDGTASLVLVAATFAANGSVPFLETDGSATVVTNRVLTTTTNLPLASPATGSCNQSQVPANLPGNTVANPNFLLVLPPKENSSFIPGAGNNARDRCAQLGGTATDAHDKPVTDGNGSASATEWDIGGLEAPK